jgi:hypothetical protein
VPFNVLQFGAFVQAYQALGSAMDVRVGSIGDMATISILIEAQEVRRGLIDSFSIERPY